MKINKGLLLRILRLTLAAHPTAAFLHAQCTQVITMGPPAPHQCFQEEYNRQNQLKEVEAGVRPPEVDPLTGQHVVHEIGNNPDDMQRLLKADCESKVSCVEVDGGYYHVDNDGKVSARSLVDGTASAPPRACYTPLPCDRIMQNAKLKQDKQQASAKSDAEQDFQAKDAGMFGDGAGDWPASSPGRPPYAAPQEPAGKTAGDVMASAGFDDGKRSGSTFAPKVEGTFKTLEDAVKKKLPGLVGGTLNALDTGKAPETPGYFSKPRPNWEATTTH